MTMAKHGVEGQVVGEEWLQDLIDTAIRQAKVRNAIEALSTELPRDTEEIEYLEARQEVAAKRLDDTRSAINEIRIQLKTSKRELIPLQKKKEAIAEEYAKLAAIEKDVEEKRAALPKLLAEIKKMREGVNKSLHMFSSVERDRREALDQREEIEKECSSLKAKLADLEKETSAINTTFSLVTGMQPEGFDFDTFVEIQEDLEEKVADFTNDMNQEIDKAQKDTVLLKKQLAEAQETEKTLLSEQDRLGEVVKDLRSQIGEPGDLESLEAETAELANQEKQLTSSNKETEQAIDRMENALTSLGERVAKENEIEAASSERHSYLTEKKKELDGFTDPEDAIRTMKEETRGLEIESKTEKGLLEMLGLLNREADPVIDGLESALEEYDGLIAGFEQEISALLSP